MERNEIIGLYRQYLNRDPSEDAIQNALQSGVTFEQLQEQILQSPEYIEGPPLPQVSQLGQIGRDIALDARADRPSTADLAYALTTGTELVLPEYQVAGLDPMATGAFEEFQANRGTYKPFLEQGAESTMQGIGALGEALGGTRELAGQIAGEITPGQEALIRAAGGVEAAAMSSDPATRLAADELMASSRRLGELAQVADTRLMEAAAGARDVAAETTGRARGLAEPLQRSVAESTSGARGIASLGQVGADVAAQRARMSTAEAQRALQAASEFGLGAAQEGIAGLRGSTAMYSPDMIAPYMSSYEDAAVQQALADIARQGQLQEQRVRDEAVQAGAYGGSRQAVAEQELARNVLEQQGRTAAQMRAQGYESAAARSQDAFERAMGRQQQASQLTGQLGQMGAGAAASAAQSGGQLGLSAEQLAQSSALQGAQLGMTAEQFASANAQAIAQTGLNIEQLAAQTGLSAQELAGNFATQSAQIGLSAEELRQAAAVQQAQLAQQQAQIGMQGAQQAGNLGLQSANLGLSGIQAGLGAQQQAAGIGQGIASLGQQAANMGGQAQQYQLQDLSTSMQMGQMQQAQTQAELDAQRLNEYQQAMLPYQQLAFQADIIGGAPTGITSTMSQPIQTPSMLSQIGGLGLTALNIAKVLP